MSLETIAQTAFITDKGIEHEVIITPNWEVNIDSTFEERFSGVGAVLVGGFIMALENDSRGSVQTYSGFYDLADSFYHNLVNDGNAEPIRDIPEKISGTNLNKYLTRMVTPVFSPFRDNILKVNVSAVKKRLLICHDMSDVEQIIQVILGSQIAEDPDNKRANDIFKSYLILSVQQRKGLTRELPFEPKPSEYKVVKNRRIPSIETVNFLDSKVTEVDTSATRKTRLKERRGEINEATQITDIVTEKAVITNREPNKIEFIPTKEVIIAVGKYIFELPANTIFTDTELYSLLRISNKDSESMSGAIVALQRAGYISLGEKGLRRTDKPMPGKL